MGERKPSKSIIHVQLADLKYLMEAIENILKSNNGGKRR